MPRSVKRTLDPKIIAARRAILGDILLKATKQACIELETTGLAVVLSSMTHWTHEGAESGVGKPLAAYLRALADLADPTRNERQKGLAELKRRKAFDRMSDHASTHPGWANMQDPEDPQI